MLKSVIEPDTVSRPEIVDLMQRLKQDTWAWAEAEATLASLELGDLRSRMLRLAVFAIIGFAAVFCSLFVLTQAAVALLVPWVGGVPLAALIVAGVLVVVIAACVWGMRSAASWQAESIFLRWIKRHPA